MSYGRAMSSARHSPGTRLPRPAAAPADHGAVRRRTAETVAWAAAALALALLSGWAAEALRPPARTLLVVLAAAALGFGVEARLRRERARRQAEIEEALVQRQTDRLGAAALASVSHDLRTPLATIVGSATTLQSLGERLTPESRVGLAEAIAV